MTIDRQSNFSRLRDLACGRPSRDVLVFTGGGSRGAVQVGMLKALHDSGVRPVGVVGASVGALNAAWYAANPTDEGIASLQDLWLKMSADTVFPFTRRGVLSGLWRRNHLASDEGVRALIAQLDLADIRDARIPLRVVTTSLESGACVVHDHGSPADVLRATCAIPGVFPPVQLGDERHIDGGISALAPVAPASEFRPWRVFILDASGPAYSQRARTALDVLRAGLSLSIRAQLTSARAQVGVTAISADDSAFIGSDGRNFERTASLMDAGYAAALLAVNRSM